MSDIKHTQSKLTQYCINLVHAILDLSEVYLWDGRLDDALHLLESDLVEQIEKELPMKEIIQLQVQRAKTMRFKCQLDGSSNESTLALLHNVEERGLDLEDKSILADVVRLIGLVIYDQELWTTTLEKPQHYFEQALILRKEINNRRGVAESLLDVGTIYQNKLDRTDEDIEKAFEYYQKAYTLATECGFMREKANTARHLGYIYGNHKGDLVKSLVYHQEFLDIHEEMGSKLYLGQAHTMVGFAHYALQDQEQALKHFESAKTIAQELGSQLPLAEALFGLGLVYEGKDNASGALRYYEKAITVARLINLRPVIQAATNRIQELLNKE